VTPTCRNTHRRRDRTMSRSAVQRLARSTLPILLVAAWILNGPTVAQAFDQRSGLSRDFVTLLLFAYPSTMAPAPHVASEADTPPVMAEVGDVLERSKRHRHAGAKIVVFRLVRTETRPVRVRISCHGCIASALLKHGTTKPSALKGQFVENKATLTIAVSAAGAYGRYLEIPDVGRGGALKRPESCVLPNTFTKTACPTASPGPPPPPPPSTPPELESAPRISGVAKVGEQLSCSPGTWAGDPQPSVTYTWQRDGAVTVGAANAPYTTTSEDKGHKLSCAVTATNTGGSKTATSETVTIDAPPQSIEPPEITGRSEVGETLHCLAGSWEGYPTPTDTYLWLRDGVPISGESGSSYTARQNDEGQELSCEVTATNSTGTTKSKSATETVVAPPKNVVLPQISGTLEAGETLSCSTGSWDGYPVPEYRDQWGRDGVAISGAEKNTYVVTTADEGQKLECEVTATNSVSFATATSQAVTILAKPKNVVLPQISGIAKAGGGLSCSKGVWAGTPEPTYTYKWLREARPIAGADEEDYEVHGEDEGSTLICEVIATNSVGVEYATSKGVAVPGEAKKRQEEEAAEKKKQEEEAKAREAKEEKEKEEHIITSFDDTKGDLAPYSGIFEVAYQPFTAESTVITYVGVILANLELPTGESMYETDIKICATPECKSGEETGLGNAKARVNNYGLTTVAFKSGVHVTPGETYYLVWTPPAAVGGAAWITFWHAGEAYVRQSNEMEAIVRGYDQNEGEGTREKISYLGTAPPPAPREGPFSFAYQNFKAVSNKITRVGAVVGNPRLARGAVSSDRLNLRLCETPECTEGHVWTPEKDPFIVNYGVTEATIDVGVVPGETYFVNWTSPGSVEGTPWVTFWYGPNAKLEDATEVQSFARGFDEGELTYEPSYYKEKPEPGHGGIATFSDYENASGPGPEIGESQTVEVACKVFAPQIASVEPEGYWYRIHTVPWSDTYYAAANPFENNTEGRKDVFTDPNVPNC
jgi:hypothetical protein